MIRGTRFPKSVRLLSGDKFKRVFEQAFRSGDACFTVLTRMNEEQTPRLGLAISKKSLRLAVDRNRVKRLVRESFRHHRHDLPCVDIVVMSRPGVKTKSNVELRESLEHHWRRLIGKCAHSSSS